VARVIASSAPIDYVHRIADVMAGCAEEDEPALRVRGEHLYNVLREVYQFAQRDCPHRLPELFPEQLVEEVRQSWASLCDRVRAPND
jgi:hypothetical protein